MNLGNKSGVDTYVRHKLYGNYSRSEFSHSPSILHDELKVLL